MAVIHLFRRDYRLVDNTALNAALASGEDVLPVFIFDKRQQPEQNEYFAKHGFRFLVESLQELDQELQQQKSKLHIYTGVPETILEELFKKHNITALYLNTDYTPFSQKRDLAIKELCLRSNVEFSSFEDVLLHPIETIKNKEGKPYKVFTPFYKEGLQHEITPPVTRSGTFGVYKDSLQCSWQDIAVEKELVIAIQPGRKAALSILKNLLDYKDYSAKRDIPSLDATTHLAPHHKFGTVSIREVAYAIMQTFGKEHPLLRQLYWREFYYAISYHFPRVYGHAFAEEFEDVEWENDLKKFEKWKTGMTGFPLVDAGMRELVSTGYMHNRVRMVVASFLTKDLHIDWRWGEKFFAQYLLDYDPAQNNGNWQWSASTGADGAPYFRIFNPWRQQERFDPDCTYIKKWIPELRELDAKAVHNLEKVRPLQLATSSYPSPMLEHKEEATKAMAYYKIAKESSKQ